MPDFEFRRTVAARDLAYCWPIYRDAMQPLIAELQSWNEAAERKFIEEIVADENSSLIVTAGEAAGWLHVDETRYEIFLSHLYLEPAARNRGLGTRFMRWMADRARRKRKAFTLEVLKNNRALVLCERLGFRTIGTSPFKLKMRLPDDAA
ncbi:MAG TPA: GNAT family N-acetyltransferase [Reyranella sp.]|jgi:GNAT superfamily N-acetyltransferase|nr:GNAT family N-acetyltransferase [Reyranella sp.]